ncbi:MAG: M24 family metallopeptidase [Bradyrhizobium sp.]
MLRLGPLDHARDLQIFSSSEIKMRRERLLKWLRTESLDACILFSADNIYYYTGVALLSPWGRPLWYALKATGESAIVGSGIELDSMRTSYFDDVIAYDDSTPSESGLEQALKKFLGPKPLSLILEQNSQPPGLAERLCTSASPVNGAGALDGFIAECRIVKTDEEMALLRIGGRIAQVGANEFLAVMRPGVTEAHVASAAVAAMNDAMAALIPRALSSSYAYCQSGPRSLMPHLHPGGRHLAAGELVALNVFPVVAGYCVELERTLTVGSPASEEVSRALEAVTRAFELGKQMIRPGVQMGSIDRATRDSLASEGYGSCFRHGAGHAHGIMIGQAGREELGELRAYNENILRENMACSVEPGIFLSDIGAVRHSDVMMVTDSGGECITAFPVLFR